MVQHTPSDSMIFGLREESWPKGHGYLYFKRNDAARPERLCDVDLFETQHDVVRSLFKHAIEKALSSASYSRAEVARLSVNVENMSSIARSAFFLEMADYIERNR